MHTITIFRGRECWMTTHTDPEFKRICGSDTAPTPFTLHTAALDVIHHLQAANPDRQVRVKQLA